MLQRRKTRAADNLKGDAQVKPATAQEKIKLFIRYLRLSDENRPETL